MPGNRQLFEKNLYFLSIKGGLWRFSVMRPAAPLFFFIKLRTRKAARRAARARARSSEKNLSVSRPASIRRPPPYHGVPVPVRASFSFVSSHYLHSERLIVAMLLLGIPATERSRVRGTMGPRPRSFVRSRRKFFLRDFAYPFNSARDICRIRSISKRSEASRDERRSSSLAMALATRCIPFSEIPIDSAYEFSRV